MAWLPDSKPWSELGIAMEKPQVNIDVYMYDVPPGVVSKAFAGAMGPNDGDWKEPYDEEAPPTDPISQALQTCSEQLSSSARFVGAGPSPIGLWLMQSVLSFVLAAGAIVLVMYAAAQALRFHANIREFMGEKNEVPAEDEEAGEAEEKE
eukprot:gene28281-31389_t